MYALNPNDVRSSSFVQDLKYDITGYSSALFAALIIFTSSLIGAMAFRIPLPETVVGAVGALLFSALIVFDTQMIVGGKGRKQQLNDKEYIGAAMLLYLDIANLFVYLLELFGKEDDDDDKDD